MVRVFGSWPASRDHRQQAMVVSGGGPAASRVALATAADPKTRIPFDGTRTSPWKLRVLPPPAHAPSGIQRRVSVVNVFGSVTVRG